MKSRSLLWGAAVVVLVGLLYSLGPDNSSSRELSPPARSSRPTAIAPAASSTTRTKSASAKRPAQAELASGTKRDRKVRDEVRRKIYAAFNDPQPAKSGAPPPEPNPNAAFAPSIPKEKKGKLDKEYIRERIREDFIPLAKECFDGALEKDPELGGKLVFEFVIVGDEAVGGIVESAKVLDSSTLQEQELEYCFEQSLLSLSFEPPEAGGSVTVTYPFLLQAGDSKDPGGTGR